MDEKIGSFLSALDDLGIREETNVAVLSDHGMAPQEGNVWMVLTRYLDPNLLEVAVEKAAYTFIALTDPLRVDEAMATLSRWPGVDVYRREDAPEHLKIADNELALDILVVSRDRAKVGRHLRLRGQVPAPCKPWRRR